MSDKDNAIRFAEWIFTNHYRLYNIQDGNHYWKNEYNIKTTEQLYQNFINEII